MMNVMAKTTEVSAKARRRRFTTAEKLRILHEADACADEKGGVAALLRREGLYSSHLASWRSQRATGQLGPSPRKRGPVPTPPDERDQQIADLERRAGRDPLRELDTLARPFTIAACPPLPRLRRHCPRSPRPHPLPRSCPSR